MLYGNQHAIIVMGKALYNLQKLVKNVKDVVILVQRPIVVAAWGLE